MSDSGFSLVDLKGISKPLTKLIDAVSNGIGAIYEPTGKVRNAKAEAKAMLILAEAEQKSNDIADRAFKRVNYREIRRQNNIDSIVKGAAAALPNTVSSEPVDEDWIVNFFELSQDVGDEEMKQIWSKLLAGEVAKPGSFKPRTLQTVKSLTPEEARMFTTMCSFSFVTGDDNYFFPIFSHDFFVFVRKHGLSTKTETHLKNIGLLSHSKVFKTADDEDGDLITVHYFSKAYYTSPKLKDGYKRVALEKYPFTEIGKELVSISGAEPNENYIKCLIEHGDLSPKT